MFDQYEVVARFPMPNVHITMVDPSVEKAARFLREAQDKAAAKVIEAMVVEVPGIDADVVSYVAEHDGLMNAVQQRCAFRVNGKTFDVRLSTSAPHDARELVRALSERIAAEVARQVVTENPGLFSKRPLGR